MPSKIGENTKIWDEKGLWGDYEIGSNCVIGKFVEIGNAKIGDNCKVEAFAFIPPGITIEDNVFIGPHVCFTNDMYPRAVPKEGEWQLVKTHVKEGASIGANSTIRCGIIIGEYSLIGAGSVVTKDVPPHALVVGNPAKVIGWVDKHGKKIKKDQLSIVEDFELVNDQELKEMKTKTEEDLMEGV
ncbi:N-acetyltransferase [archaeon]|nr:N-acetyltransferase [archaeon]